MKVVHTTDNLIEVQILKELLKENHIECYIPGELLSGAAGELPARIFHELSIVNDSDEDKAAKLITNYQHQHKDKQGTSWVCQCGETHDSHFTQCWKCGSNRTTDQ